MDICIAVVCISWLIVKTIIDSNSSGPLKLGQFNARKKRLYTYQYKSVHRHLISFRRDRNNYILVQLHSVDTCQSKALGSSRQHLEKDIGIQN